MIYLDYNATTPLLPEVRAAMEPYLTAQWGNPSSAHSLGRAAAQAVAHARSQVAALVGVEAAQVVFTGSATEANNTALAAAVVAGGGAKRKLVTVATEHSAVLGYGAALAAGGVPVVIVPVLATGVVDLAALERAMTPDTAVVSMMWANNETGVINPVATVAKLCADRGARFHCDAAQAGGKIAIDLSRLAIDYLTLSAHKLYGPKGVGALVIRPGSPYRPLLIGGHQEADRRGGTENVPAIVGFGCAAELAAAELGSRSARVADLRDHLEGAVLAEIPGTYCNGAGAPRIANTTNLGFSGLDAESLVKLLDGEGICVSAGSACLAHSPTPSHVVQAMTGSYAKAGEAIRFSLSHLNTDEEVPRAVRVLRAKVAAIRGR